MADAESLTQRMDALARALHGAGVEPGRIATILESAATATMHALLLDAVLDESARPREQQPAQVEQPAVPAEPLRVAA